MKLLPNLKTLADIAVLEAMGVEIEFDPQEEELSPDCENEEDNEAICKLYDKIGLPAWFSAHVIVKFRGIEGDDYLGCCSYNSFREFQAEEGGYYIDMINQSIDEVNRQAESINFGVQRQWDIRRAKNIIKPYGLHIVSNLSLSAL